MTEEQKQKAQTNARMGAVYLWQGTVHRSPIAQTVLAGSISSISGLAGTGDITILVPDQSIDFSVLALEASRDPGAKGSLWRSVLSWAESFLKGLWTKLKDIWNDRWDIGVHVKKVALLVAQYVYAKAAPFIGASSTLLSGLVKAGTSFVEKFSTWMSSGKVAFNYGHPETIVRAIEWGITRSMLDGVYDIARSSISLSVNAASFGGAAIVDGIASVVDAAVKILWRVYESTVISDFCRRAKDIWKTRSNKNSAIRKPGSFDRWFRPAVEQVPVLAAVTLGSGVAGDKMRFLNMFADRKAIITQGQFDAGCDYLEQVKRSASRMIIQSEIDFTSDDEMIQGLLTLAKNYNSNSSSSNTWWTYWGLDKIFRS